MYNMAFYGTFTLYYQYIAELTINDLKMDHFYPVIIVILYAVSMYYVLKLTKVPTAFYIMLSFLYYRMYNTKRKNVTVNNMKIAFVHTVYNIGTDAENVLWNAVQALQMQYPNAEIYIYMEQIDVCPTEVLRKVKRNLNIFIEKNVKFLYLDHRNKFSRHHFYHNLIDSIYLGIKALNRLVPDVFVDTISCSSFAFVFKYFANVKTISYENCPTDITHIPERAWEVFKCDKILVNSTFAQKQISSAHLVYPPCQVDYLKTVLKDTQKTKTPEKIRIISLLQFRPNQDNQFQLHVLHILKQTINEVLFQKITLILCGTCRNFDDKKVVEDLKKLSRELGIENNVKIVINIPYDVLLDTFKQAYISIHANNCEHFGINVVEQMAAGLIMVANEFEKVCLDIIDTSEDSRTGYLAVTTGEFASSLKTILEASDEQNNEIRERAKASVDRYSIQNFQTEFLEAVNSLFE